MNFLKKKPLILFLVASAIIVVSLTIIHLHYKAQIHFHAGFQVYKDDKLVDFSDLKYMHIEPCGDEEHKEDEQTEKAHLHDGVGDVVHVHRENAKWADLFLNIKYQMDPKIVEGYVNGQKVENILGQNIMPYESVIFLVGRSGSIEKYLSKSVSVEHIKETEKKSELCGKD